MNTKIEELRNYIKRYRKCACMEKETERTYTIVANKLDHAEIAKKAILLGLKIKTTNECDIFRSLKVYY